MKKYIRTKDGVYDLETKNNDDEFENQIADIEEISYGGKNGSCVLIPQKCILAEADTIEELCDMTIVVDDERPDNVFELEWYIDKDLINKYKDVKGVYLYGAIWTPKGLIYVAKMNDEGELELI